MTMTMSLPSTISPSSSPSSFINDFRGKHHHNNIPPTMVEDDVVEEERPTARAARMVVGLSQSSFPDVTPINKPSSKTQKQASIPASAVLAPSTSATISFPPRQESEGTATSSTEFTTSDHYDLFDSSEGGKSSQTEPTAASSGVDNEMERREDEDWMSSSASVGSGMFSLQKLYGREQQEAMLFDTYACIMEQQQVPRSQLNYTLISGSVGTGKTSLADSLRRKVKKDGGYFCTGTFDQMMQRGPIAPLVDAFAEYVRQVFDFGTEEVQIARHRIHSLVDTATELPSLMRILPSLRELMGQNIEHDNNADNDAKIRRMNEEETNGGCTDKREYSHFAMMKLMRAISRPERPVVMLLDDLQYAGGGCTFEFLETMVLDDMNDSMMYLGITRNDVTPGSSISKFLRTIEDRSVRITNIELSNLNLEDVHEMINDSFMMPKEQMESLGDFLFEHSYGNPFFVATSIQTIQNEPRFLNYDKETNAWNLNSDVADHYMKHCPIHLTQRKLDTFPRDEKKVLMVVSCLGSHSTQRMIEAALQEDATDSLKKLVKKAKLNYDGKDQTYTIKHNVVKTASYNLIGQELQPAFHLEVGLRLMRNLDAQELDDNLFRVIMQLEMGISLLQDQPTKYEVASLFVRGAEKAAVTSSFQASHWALNHAYNLLGDNRWEEAYELTIVIYNYLAEIEFALEDNERVDNLLEEIDKHGRSCSDKLQSYTTRVHVLGVRGYPDAAIDKGINILRCLGVRVPSNSCNLNLLRTMMKINGKIKRMSNEMVKRLPKMTDPTQLTAMQVLNLLFLDTFLHRRELFPFVILKMMKMSLVHGLSAMSSVAFAGYGALLCFMGKAEEGQRFGKLALDLVDQLNASSFRSRCIGLVYGCIQPATQPLKNSLIYLKEGHRLGLMTGDVEFAMFNAHLHTAFMLEDASFEYEVLMSHLNDFIKLTETRGQSRHLHMLMPIKAALEVYHDPNGDLMNFTGPIEDGLKFALESGNKFSAVTMYCCSFFFLFSAGEYQKGLKVMDERKVSFPIMNGSIFEVFPVYMDGLFAFGVARLENNRSTRKKLIQRGKRAMKFVQKLAMQNPDSCMGKAALLEAEYAALCNKNTLAKQKYSQAIALSIGHKNTCEIVFSNQVMGMHYFIDLNDPVRGVKYLEDAISACKAWGGHAAATLWEKNVQTMKEKRRFSILRQSA